MLIQIYLRVIYYIKVYIFIGEIKDQVNMHKGDKKFRHDLIKINPTADQEYLKMYR